MFVLFWLWLRGRLRTPAELERRRRRGHPWSFMLSGGIGVTYLATASSVGDVLMGLLFVAFALVLVVV